MTRRVVFAVFDGVEVMDLAGPLQAFHEAAAFGHAYATALVGPAAKAHTAQGLTVADLAPLPRLAAGDRVVVPGYPVRTTRPPRALSAWLRAAFDGGARVLSVCTGAFVLGEAGLLDGRRCTTHWRRVAELQERFPQARVLGDRLFVEDGAVVTSAGIASGIDLALAELERDGGPALASSVAREMVVYVRRDGARRQESVWVDHQSHLNPAVHLVQQFLVTHPDSDASIAELGRTAGMSERNLRRVFRRATGVGVQEYRQRLRLERARDLLRDPSLTVEAVAARCGFADARQLRRLWRQRFGSSPTAERGGS